MSINMLLYKPWLSIALKKSINIKNEMFYSIIKDNSDNEKRWVEYKNYRNCLNRAIMLAKKIIFSRK